MSVDDDWRVTSPAGDEPEPPKPTNGKYRLDIDAPLLSKSDQPITGPTPKVGSLSWSQVTTHTGSTDMIPSNPSLTPVLGAAVVTAPSTFDRSDEEDGASPQVTGPTTVTDPGVRTQPDEPQPSADNRPSAPVPTVSVDEDELARLAELAGKITGPAPEVSVPHGAPIHRATASDRAPLYRLDVDVSGDVPAIDPHPAPVGAAEPDIEAVDETIDVADGTDVDEETVVAPEPPIETAVPISASVGVVDTLADIPDAPPSEEVELVIEIDDPPPVQVPASALSLSAASVYQPHTAAQATRAATPMTYALDSNYMRPRRRRSPAGLIVKLLLTLALLAGAAYAVKVFVIDAMAWPDDVTSLVTTVEEVHGLTFEQPVPITELAYPDYAARLQSSLAGYAGEDWVAFGVAPDSPTESWLDRSAVIETPSFYDPVAGEIVELEGMPPAVRRVALARAMSAALLDQRGSWSAGLEGAGLAEAVGLTAVIDGAGRNVADAILAQVGRSAWGAELFGFAGTLPEQQPLPTSSYFTAMVGRPGIASQAVTAGLQGEELLAVVSRPPTDDARVIDPAREPSGMAGGSSARGMMFWYHVLAERLDARTAWSAVVGWRSDDVVAQPDTNGTCWSATIAGRDQQATDMMTLAFQAWATGAPSPTAVERPSPTSVLVRVCPPAPAATPFVPFVAPSAGAVDDLGEAPAVESLSAAVMLPFGGAPVERALVAMAGERDPLDAAAATCLVDLARERGQAFDTTADAVPLLTLTGWSPAWATANLDLAAAC